mmetsp:Transcript_37624/g.108449  ORF Transcript_37624/g.108449 Transcript_37624/m.108449 type:complete len:246 (+) Transcript_37624:73-810(+)
MPLLEELVDPPRCRDNDMATTLQPLQLLALGLPARDRAAEDAAGAAKLEGLQLDLPRELARGRQHKHHRPPLHVRGAAEHVREAGAQERQGLAAATLRDADEVVAGGQNGPALRLNRGWLREAGLLDLAVHLGREVRGLERLYGRRHGAAAEGADHLHFIPLSVVLSVLRIFCRRAARGELVPHGRCQHVVGLNDSASAVSSLKLGPVGLPLVVLVDAPPAEVLRLDALLPLGLTLILPVQVIAH